MNTNTGDLHALIEEKIGADNDFQASIESLSDEEKEQAISQKRSELLNAEFSSLREKASKNEELANNYKTRAEKAEDELKPFKKPTERKMDKEEPQPSGLSQKDVLVLAKADVHEDDIEEVIGFAQYKKIPIADALKNQTLKTILAQRKEERDSANAANVNSARRTTNKSNPSELVANLSKGKVPEKGSKDAEELFWARRGGRRS